MVLRGSKDTRTESVLIGWITAKKQNTVKIIFGGYEALKR